MNKISNYTYYLLILMIFSSVNYYKFSAQNLHAEESEKSTVKSFYSGDIKKGWSVFFRKQCIQCHSIWGEGGAGSPDLGKTSAYFVSSSQLAEILWNHAPNMWAKMNEMGVPFPTVNEQEMSDLFMFLFFIRYMGIAGNSENGKVLLHEKRCVECHNINGFGGRVGPELTRWGNYLNPVVWLQMMWNAQPKMKQEMDARGISFPVFKGNDLGDIIYYIVTVTSSEKKFFLSPGDGENGRKLFIQKGCIKCHSLRSSDDGIGPNLLNLSPYPKSIAEFGMMMWNHSPKMWNKMREKGIERPVFSGKEMADIATYVFYQKFIGDTGNPLKGRRVFEDKRCIVCHKANSEVNAPDVRQLKKLVSPVSFAFAMWSHGRDMLVNMESMGIDWPIFKEGEMKDLIEYIKNE